MSDLSTLSTAELVDIVLDPGHGGKDPGAVDNGLKEKDIVLEIGKRTKAELEKRYNARVHMTRSTDVFIELADRAAFANKLKAKMFVSIHVNAGGGTGYETYIYNKTASQKTKDIQKILTDEIFAQAQKFGAKAHGNDLYREANYSVLRNTNMSAVLTENMYIDTTADANLLKNPKFIDALVLGHVNGIAKALGLKKKAGVIDSPKETAPATDGNLYFVQCGAFSKKENADDLVKHLAASGFKSFPKLDGKLYKVQVGAYSKIANAEDQVKALKAKGFEAIIVQ